MVLVLAPTLALALLQLTVAANEFSHCHIDWHVLMGMIAQFVEALLAVDAAESRSKFDLYRMVYNCHFDRPTIQIKTNIDYKESLLARASYVVEQAATGIPRYLVQRNG